MTDEDDPLCRPCRQDTCENGANRREKIEAKIERYALTGEGDIKALKVSGSLRLRVGNYRVIFTEDFEIIDIEEIGHRREIYL